MGNHALEAPMTGRSLESGGSTPSKALSLEPAVPAPQASLPTASNEAEGSRFPTEAVNSRI